METCVNKAPRRQKIISKFAIITLCLFFIAIVTTGLKGHCPLVVSQNLDFSSSVDCAIVEISIINLGRLVNFHGVSTS